MMKYFLILFVMFPSIIFGQDITISGYWQGEKHPDQGYYFEMHFQFKSNGTFSGHSEWYFNEKKQLWDPVKMKRRGRKVEYRIAEGKVHNSSYLSFAHEPKNEDSGFVVGWHKLFFSPTGDYISGQTRLFSGTSLFLPGRGGEYGHKIGAKVISGDWFETLEFMGFNPYKISLDYLGGERNIELSLTETSQLFTNINYELSKLNNNEAIKDKDFSKVYNLAVELIYREPFNAGLYNLIGSLYENMAKDENLDLESRFSLMKLATVFYNRAYSISSTENSIYVLGASKFNTAAMLSNHPVDVQEKYNMNQEFKDSYLFLKHSAQEHGNSNATTAVEYLEKQYPSISETNTSLTLYSPPTFPLSGGYKTNDRRFSLSSGEVVGLILLGAIVKEGAEAIPNLFNSSSGGNSSRGNYETNTTVDKCELDVSDLKTEFAGKYYIVTLVGNTFCTEKIYYDPDNTKPYSWGVFNYNNKFATLQEVVESIKNDSGICSCLD